MDPGVGLKRPSTHVEHDYKHIYGRRRVPLQVLLLQFMLAKDKEKSQRRSFEINKKLQIAQAIISTYQGAQGAFASATLNPITIGFPAYPGIMAGIAVASGLANVAQISNPKP